MAAHRRHTQGADACHAGCPRDDVLVAKEAIPATHIAAGARFRVLDNPRRVNDGMEMEALLGSATP